MVVDIESLDIRVLQQITPNQAWHYRIIPFEVNEKQISFFSEEGENSHSFVDELELLFGKTIHLRLVDTDLLRKFLGKYYRQGKNGNTAAIQISNFQGDSDFLERLIKEAQQLSSSDIHLESFEKFCRIRFRIDGVLIERYRLEKENYPSIVNKIKIKANLDIAEKRLPQDGRIFFEEKGLKFDIRVSSLPTLHGEKIVMRLLSNDKKSVEIERLGFDTKDLEKYLEGVYRPNGMVLISGPTGSGKTTTLYATLQILNKTERNILTIEDPIEYTLEGVNQVQLKEAIGLNFASAMRTFLRQDPDIIMVGEIRDLDTASMAIRASLTGHLVLSTIHTNSAWGIVSRLIDMGIPSYLLADTLNTAVAQRLVRTLCPHCKEKVAFEQKMLPRNYKAEINLITLYRAKGCETCYYTGYKGRKAVYEVIGIDDELSDRIKQKDLNVVGLLKNKGIQSLANNAFVLLSNGITTIEEIYPILVANSF